MSLTPTTGPDLLAAALERGGSVRTAAADVAEVEEWAAAHGRTVVQLDSVDSSSGDELIDVMSDAFAFPEDTVDDWDSLDEGLGDYDVAPAEGLVAVWSNWDSVAMDDEPAMAVAVDVLRTAAQYWCDDGVPWTVVVVGEGPAWDLPWAGAGRAPWEQDEDDDEDEFDEADEYADADVSW